MVEEEPRNTDTPWQIDGQLVRLQLEKLHCELAFAQPQNGLNVLQAGHEPLPGSLMQVIFASGEGSASNQHADRLAEHPVSEAYLRGKDAVVDYPPQAGFPFRSQIYWRALSAVDPPAIAALEVIVSTQTDLLDSHPQVSVSTMLPAIELWRLASLEKAEFKQVSLSKVEPQRVHYTQGPGCYLWRLSGDRWSFAEMLPPSDFHSTDITRDSGGMTTLTHNLFERSLEKGVILRSRVRGVLLERGRDAVSALAWYRELLESELPLTA